MSKLMNVIRDLRHFSKYGYYGPLECPIIKKERKEAARILEAAEGVDKEKSLIWVEWKIDRDHDADDFNEDGPAIRALLESLPDEKEPT